MAFRGLFFTEEHEHLDVFAVDLHETGPSGGDVHWRGAATGESRASFEGLIQIDPGAQQTHTYLQIHSMMLSPKARVDAIPSVLVSRRRRLGLPRRHRRRARRGAIFYMQTRGLTVRGGARDRRGLLRAADRQSSRRAAGALMREKIGAKLAAARDDIEAMPPVAENDLLFAWHSDCDRLPSGSRCSEAELDVRADFPILAREIDGRRLVYLDSGATSQKPQVRDRGARRLLRNHNANVHRGVYPLAQEADAAVRGRPRADRRLRRTHRPERRSSRRTSPRRSTSSPTPGARQRAVPATRC
jgi:hypothetical protein